MPENYDINLFIIQIFLIIILGIIMIFLLRLTRSIKYERRLGKFGLESLKQENPSFFDQVNEKYTYIKGRLTKGLKKIHIFDTYSLKYEKYMDRSKRQREDPMDYISTKIITGVVVLIIVILSDVLQYKPIHGIQFVYSLLIGFFIPDVFLISLEKYRKKQIENDLLKAVIIMNNAFKSGRSTMQAIQIVGKELDGPIAEEFRKMYIDLSYGLSLETVFGRFSKRVNIQEVKYMTTSLTILNKTGGNIVKVFSSIERSFFNRKKLDEELHSLTASANAIFKILVAMPVLIFLLIFVLNPTYFAPLVSGPIGWLLLMVILVIYIGYIFIIQKVMHIKEI